MVSFFGLKLGGDKKKKSGQATDQHGSQSRQKIDQNTLGEGQFFGNDLARPGTYAASIYSTTSRPGSSYSTYRSKKSAGQKQSVYTNDTHNLAALSYYDLGSRPATSYAPSFAKAATNFNLQWNGSSTNLEAPPTLGSRRPSVSSVKSARQKAWVNPLDVHFGKRDSSASAIAPQPTQGLRPSPLSKKENAAAPPLPTAPAVPARNPLRNPPSPPRSISRSIRTTQELDSCFSLDQCVGAGASNARPPSPVSQGTTQTNEARPLYPGVFGASSLPSPPLSVSRTSDDASRSSASTWGEPVIQNVSAKRETIAVGASRQRSLKMKVERTPARIESATMPQRPKTSGGHDTQRTDRRPAALDLSLPNEYTDSGPSSATFGRTQPPADLGRERSATIGRTTGPPPIASIGALDRLSKANNQDTRRQSRHQYTHSAVRASYSSSVYDSPPQSPESPVIPLSGPLASPRPPLPMVKLPRYPSEASDYAYDLPDWSALAEDAPHSDDDKSGQGSATRNWPLLSAGRTAQKAPQLPDARSDSPFGIPSFSRPWTGVNARPGTPIKTTEITITTSLRTQSPPKTAPIYGLRNPAIVGDDFGTGFI
ncbi:hypothetical protein PGQ11_014120 [Apiospora arundinis]|uniref:Proteophosphoglycan ppg4 n=1 Tax=Apiospora arundinis TaxID=335852 RepID=A0ABR2HRI2_9PEZI